ncbi:MAG: cupin domain-containing protein [Fimbriimonas sp.]
MKDAIPHQWDTVPLDNPIPLLTRWKVQGDQMLLARVRLEKDCVVALHQHESEQMAVVLSGHVRWTVGAEGEPNRREFEMKGGEVLQLPSNVWHGLTALEDTIIVDILSPAAPMGVDRQDVHD